MISITHVIVASYFSERVISGKFVDLSGLIFYFERQINYTHLHKISYIGLTKGGIIIFSCKEKSTQTIQAFVTTP